MHIPEIVRYDAADITKLSDAMRHCRPEKRQHKNITDTYAMMFLDYTFLDLHLQFDETVFRGRSSFCVEIKPKQGYLQQAEQQITRCPYCLIQYAKLRRKSVSARSNYCPFDLFSGVEARMKDAVEGLLKSPQNNLKIFRDGVVVYDQESQPGDLEDVLNQWFQNAAACRNKRAGVDEFCNLVCTALTRPLGCQEQLEALPAAIRPARHFLLPSSQVPTFCAESSAVARVERCLRLAGKACNFDGNGLPRGSVLERIWNVQRLFYMNTNYIHSIYSKFSALLNDDMIYSDLTKLHGGHADVPCTLSEKHKNAVVQKTQAIKGIYLQTLLNSTIETKCDDDLINRNRSDAGPKRILSANSDKMLVNGGFVPQTGISPNSGLQQSFCERNESPHNQIPDNEGDERKANASITAEHLLALQNYLLFATVRDCSILMTFRELHPEKAWRVPAENTIKLSEQLCFLSSVRISDLDSKSVHSIEKHRQRDVDIFDAVISSLEEEILLKNK